MKHALKVVPTLLIFLLLFCAGLMAQDRGIITGTVTDPSGAAVAGATVTITNQATRVPLVVQTSTAGIYTVPVPAGMYQVETQMSGFKVEIWKDIQVGVLQNVTVNMKLEMGTVAEHVTVTGSAPLLNTVSSTMSTNMSPREYAELPLFVSGSMRGATNLTTLLPGVTVRGSLSINGGEMYSREFQLDGASVVTNLNTAGNTNGFQVPVDAIQEFTVTTNMFSAEFGRTGGGIESFTLKSGTNAFHGLAYEFNRNTDYDARGFYPKNRPIDKQNEFGAQIGGPLKIPKLYNGKDRTFFFADYTGYRYATAGTNYLSTVPTALMRQGNFTQYVGPTGALIPIYDPSTTAPDGKGGYTRTQFPGNIIPSADFSKVALAIQSYIPAANNGTGWQNDYLSSDTNRNKEDNVTVKVDHSIGSRQKLSGSMVITQWPYTNPAALPGPISGKLGLNNDGRIARISYDLTIKPNMINHLTLGYNRFIQSQLGLYNTNNGTDWSQTLGIKVGGVCCGLGTNNGFNAISIAQENSLGGGGTVVYWDNTSNVLDSVLWQHGHHSIKFGVEIRKMESNNINKSGEPSFSFGQAPTAFPSAAGLSAGTGQGYATFLLGLYSGASVYINPVTAGARWAQYMSYFQDDWKITSRLTINLGVRYDVPKPYHDAHLIQSTVDLTLPNPAAGNILGALIFGPQVYAATGRKSFFNTDWKEFGPRIGLAYSLPGNMVLRTGYGIYYTAGTGIGNGLSACEGSSSCGNGGWSLSYSLPSPAGVSAYDPWGQMDNGMPQTWTPPPSLTPGYNLSGTASAILPSAGRSPYIQNWNFGLQKQTRSHILLDVSYVGSKGTRLVAGRDAFSANFLQPQYWGLANVNGVNLLADSITNPAVVAAGYKLPYPTFTGTLAQALLPYPQYARMTISNSDGNSTYHSFQFKAQKRMSNGVTFLADYTLSKTIANTFSQYNRTNTNGAPNMLTRDIYDGRIDKVLSPNDRTHVVNISFLYELPFGPGKPLAHNGRLLGALVGGWQLNSVLQYASGLPLTITGPQQVNTGTAPTTATPNTLLGVPQTNNYGTWDQATSVYLNRAAWALPALTTLGTSSFVLNKVRSFWSPNENVGLFKTIPLHESVKLQLRLEGSNIFNRFIPADPNTAWSASSTVFGKSTGQANTARSLQIGAKLTF